MDLSTDSNAEPVPPATGRIDIHSHLLPSVDDGCVVIEESLECVRRLQAAGFVGSILTPHIDGRDVDCNQIQHVRGWVKQFRQQLHDAGIDYLVWPGGELRLFDGVIDWFENHGVPTLAGSRCVLVDFWEWRWPKWVMPALAWLLDHQYQPILAHPERILPTRALQAKINELIAMDVWFQGNFRPMTGQDGFEPDRWVRRFLQEDHYQFMATDAHRPTTLDDRIDGMHLVEREFGRSKLDELTIDAPRNLILSP